MLSLHRAIHERLDSHHRALDQLKRELAEAWASPDGRGRISSIEKKIRDVWEQMDGLAVYLSEPSVGPGSARPHRRVAEGQPAEPSEARGGERRTTGTE